MTTTPSTASATGSSAAVPYHARAITNVARQLTVETATGLSGAAARERLAQYGANELQEKDGTPAWVRFLHQFKSPLIYVLLAAVIIAAFLGEFKDAGVIFGVLMLNAIIGFIQEGRAERSMAALKNLSSPQSQVRRDGRVVTVPSRELVPGDVLIISAGDKIAAAARLRESAARRKTRRASPANNTATRVSADGAFADVAGDLRAPAAGGNVPADAAGQAVLATRAACNLPAACFALVAMRRLPRVRVFMRPS